jgi:hypothetical protein
MFFAMNSITQLWCSARAISSAEGWCPHSLGVVEQGVLPEQEGALGSVTCCDVDAIVV